MNANTVRQDRFINLLNEHAPVLSRWSYQADQPFSVTVAFQTGADRWVEWVFARDLLVAGLVGPAGIGDVRFVPFEDGEERLLLLQVESDEGRASWFLDRREAEEFVETSLYIVPEGKESDVFDLEGFIDEILDV
ncbi:MAG: SsgA family sporulation/cell division regulator [Pseudonocardiaceae bacterium]